MARARTGEAPKKGRIDLPWRKDPEILMRLSSVSKMMIQGARLWQIAQALGYSLGSAKNDADRVRILWKDEASEDVNENRRRSIALLRTVQEEAWVALRAGGDKKPKNPLTLRIIRECESQIMALQGTEAPIKKELTGKGGGPIEIDTGAAIDLTVLSEEELDQFETLVHKATQAAAKA